MKPIFLLTDNAIQLERFLLLIKKMGLENDTHISFEYAYSPSSRELMSGFAEMIRIRPINVKADIDQLVDTYDLIISLHCKQLFPAALVNGVRCVNVHPGLNPHNRGWYPQVFSILNGRPGGATIHEIDEKLDHGPVICQKEVPFHPWDTSLTAYNRVLDAEIELLQEYLPSIINNTYETFQVGTGNLNLKADFNALCEIQLDDMDTFQNHINRLRALTHG